MSTYYPSRNAQQPCISKWCWVLYIVFICYSLVSSSPVTPNLEYEVAMDALPSYADVVKSLKKSYPISYDSKIPLEWQVSTPPASQARFYPAYKDTLEQRKQQAYQLWKTSQIYPSPEDPPSLLKPVLFKKILALDLDETLVHSENASKIQNVPADFRIDYDNLNGPTFTYVYKRPFVDYFLKKAAHYFDLVLFTASEESYARAVLKHLDPHQRLFKELYFRQDCILNADGVYIKDLGKIHTDLSKILLLDNNPASYSFQPHNGIPIQTWLFYQQDVGLKKMARILKHLSQAPDVRLADKTFMK